MSCRLCRSKEVERIEPEEYLHCLNCGFIMTELDELPEPVEEIERYDEHDNSFNSPGYVKMFHDFIDWGLRDILSGIDTALDFGAGPGPVLAELLREHGINVSLYDPFYYDYPERLKKKYDLITSTEVFEHFHYPAKEIEILVDALKPGAYLAVMTHFHPGADKFAGWWYKYDDTHVGFYNRKTMEWIAKNYGMKIIKIDEFKQVLFQKKRG